jgi:PAS domain S-box-containing protein
MWETIVAGEIWKGEFINKKKNGEIFWESAIISPLTSEKGDITHYVAVKEDITERKEVEEELRQFKQFADTSIEGFGMAELNSRILYQNKRLCDLCGIEEAKINESFLQFYPKKAKKKLREKIIPMLIKEGHWRGELDHLKPGGGTFPTIHNFFVIRDEMGQPKRLAATITDITEIKKIESELKESKEIAEEANRTKSAFLANMSHEIRTPMNSILGFTEMLSSKVDDPKQSSYLNSIRSSGRSLLNLINDILDLSKVEAGGIDINYDLIGTRAFFRDLKSIFQAYSKEKDLEFNFKLDKDVPPGFYLDELRLRQILTNLLSNAIKFTHKGSVSLSIHQEMGDKTSSRKTKEPFMDLIIRVADTGIGISDDFMPKLFSTFEQEDGEITRRYGGTGLGLAISKKLAELMNGEILVDNTPSKGSVFTLHLKQVKISSQVEEEIPASEFSMEVPVFPKGRVLIADDHPEIRDFFAEVFSDTGLETKIVSDGKKALNQARKNKPDLIITDIKMPVMDGYELNKKIKKDPDLQGIPVIAITASAMKEEIEKIRRSKFEGLLLKPISSHELMAEVQKFIRSKKKSKKRIERQAVAKMQFTDEERQKLPELIKIIDKDWMIDWQRLQKQQAMAEVELFGKKIRNAGEEYKIDFLSQLGKEIIQSVQAFDIERIRKFIKEFPDIVEKLRKIK